MKQLILIMSLALSINAYAQQDDQTATLTVSGQGETIEEAKTNALRSAIEQAFGTFISSKTEILNDELVKDEIVSVANGNIQKFEIISEVQIPNGRYATTLKAIVSVTKLTTFCESKGVEVEFKGGLFAANILIQELYEKNEILAVENLTKTLNNISLKSFDYSIKASDPYSTKNGDWDIPITVNVTANNNFINIPTLLEQTIKSLSLSDSELNNYVKLNKEVYPITLATMDKEGIYYLRNSKSITLIIDFIYSLNNAVTNFEIYDGIKKKSIEKYNLTIDDRNFRLILKNRNDGGWCGICAASLFHNFCGSRHDSKIPNFNYKDVYSNGMDYSIEYGSRKDQNCNMFSRDKFKSFYPLKKLVMKNSKLGLVISFATIKSNSLVVEFKFNDTRSIDEIKKITKYEVTPKK